MEEDTPSDAIQPGAEANLPAESDESTTLQRDERGRFVKGRSGNPAGRTKGSRNRIAELKAQHELALREYMSDPSRQTKVLNGLDNIFRIMQAGRDKDAVAAAKLVFGQLIPKSSGDSDEGSKGPGGVTVIIENNTGKDAGVAQPGVTIDLGDGPEQ